VLLLSTFFDPVWLIRVAKASLLRDAQLDFQIMRLREQEGENLLNILQRVDGLAKRSGNKSLMLQQMQRLVHIFSHPGYAALNPLLF
jgi:hypothetical protein